jgi:hypothetical protein
MKLISFTCTDQTYFDNVPVPAKKVIPQWYKDGESYYYTSDSPEPSAGLKTCMPFLDVLISGYCLVLPFDIYVGKKEDGSVSIEWNSPEKWGDFVGQRPHESGATIPRPAGHMDAHFVWSNKWGWKTPRGYSTIVTHPYNRFDLPFTTMSGFMDSDKISVNGRNDSSGEILRNDLKIKDLSKRILSKMSSAEFNSVKHFVVSYLDVFLSDITISAYVVSACLFNVFLRI